MILHPGSKPFLLSIRVHVTARGPVHIACGRPTQRGFRCVGIRRCPAKYSFQSKAQTAPLKPKPGLNGPPRRAAAGSSCAGGRWESTLSAYAGGVAILFETDIDDTKEHTGSFLYLSIPYYWLRELKLAFQAKQWQLLEATIESAHRSLGGYQQTIRLEIWYSYSFNGQSYSDHLIRDTGFSWGIKTALGRYPKGSRVPIRVNPYNPDESYLPSGLNWIEPLLMSVVSFGSLALILAIVANAIISAIFHS